MPRIRITLRRIVALVAVVAATISGLFLSVRRDHLLQKAAYFEHRAKVGHHFFDDLADPEWAAIEKRYQKRCTEAARAYRRAASFPLLPDPPEPTRWE